MGGVELRRERPTLAVLAGVDALEQPAVDVENETRGLLGRSGTSPDSGAYLASERLALADVLGVPREALRGGETVGADVAHER